MARIAVQNAEGGVNGRQIKVVTADDQGTPSGALSAAQTLVGVDNAFAVATTSVVAPLGAESYFLQNAIPVVGSAIDGAEWAPPNNNLFPVQGSPSKSFPSPVWEGAFFKQRGATRLAVLNYANEPSGAANAANFAFSAQHAGIVVPYKNGSTPLTQEGNFGPIIQQMKAAKVNAVAMVFLPETFLPFLEEAQQAGLKLKVALAIDEPPASTLQNSSARSAMQDVWTFSPFQFAALQTPAIKTLEKATLKYEHQTAVPNEEEEMAWAAASGIIQGLQVAGRNPTRASFTSGFRKVSNFNGGGLLVTPQNMKIAFGTGADGTGPSPQSCVYVEQFVGQQWKGQTNPLCGGMIPNSNVG